MTEAATPLAFSTPRCVVDRVSGADRAALLDLLRDEPVWRHLGGPRPEARWEGWIADVLRPDDGDGGVRAVRLTEGGEMIGLLFLAPHHEGIDVELSNLFASRHWGRGLAGETVGALLRRARDELDLTRIVAETQAANEASRRLLGRLGLVPERRLVRFGAEQIVYATAQTP